MKISLVVPLKDEACSVEKLLSSISAQTLLPSEVIFIDAGSIDTTKAIIENHESNGLEMKVLSIGAAYPGTARNVGVREARFECIAFTDGGIELDKDWLKELNSFLDCDVVYGNYIPRTDTLFKQCVALAVVPPPRLIDSILIRPRFIASSMVKKNVWQEVGGFPDLRAAEDKIFMEKIERNGFKIKYNPKANVIWDIPSSIKEVFNRFSNYSYHDLKAKRCSDWHLPVLKMYLAVFLFAILGVYLSPVFYLLLPLGLLLRTAKKVIINRREPYFKIKSIPIYIMVLAFLIALIDFAMFAGWARYLIFRSQR